MSFALDKKNAIFLGVCAGFAKMTRTDVLWWRLGAVFGTIVGFGILPIIYLLIAWLAQPRTHDA
ncbi:PspC domain-containing protein [Sphingosinicella sp.]|jgi:phage shock protein C|uniref:PspC domain-containing protein n=1 Tax=Sphingosinicella sp. TaxID=1917971 RepID=UPI0017CE3DBB|nr:PspC domain-containing protein [Sphingosinicella sp.]MBA4759268.1 PspC domain-containing protein [Sphingosinicella sp.]